MSIAQENRLQYLQSRLAALEAAFLRPREANTCESCTCKDDLVKIKNDLQGVKMRMGREK